MGYQTRTRDCDNANTNGLTCTGFLGERKTTMKLCYASKAVCGMSNIVTHSDWLHLRVFILVNFVLYIYEVWSTQIVMTFYSCSFLLENSCKPYLKNSSGIFLAYGQLWKYLKLNANNSVDKLVVNLILAGLLSRKTGRFRNLVDFRKVPILTLVRLFFLYNIFYISSINIS
jgi:hypothetical protein